MTPKLMVAQLIKQQLQLVRLTSTCLIMISHSSRLPQLLLIHQSLAVLMIAHPQKFAALFMVDFLN